MQKTLPKKEKDRRAKVMVVIIAIAFFACVGNLFRIQVVQADYYKGKAEENQLYDTEIPAQRGTIYDSEEMSSHRAHRCGSCILTHTACRMIAFVPICAVI